MSFASVKSSPPFYLLTQPLANSCAAANFAHPVLEYHFADDPPSRLLPKSDAEAVIILDYEDSDATPVARSLHSNLAVAGVKVTVAPGAIAARDGEVKRSDKMYIVETLNCPVRESGTGDSIAELDDPQLLLAQFRERNTVLRRVLDQPMEPSTSSSEPDGWSKAP